MEPLQKELMPGIAASLDVDGTLTLSEVATVTIGDETVTMPTVTTVQLPAVAVRALLNLLRTEKARTLIGYRKWQKEGKKHDTKETAPTNGRQTSRLGHLQRLIRRWLR